jgi:hypothetical protein
MNIISIDASLVSTAMLVYNGVDYKIFNYCRDKDMYNKTGITKWYKMGEDIITYKTINYSNFDNYSDGELVKLSDYDIITDNIVKDIISNINRSLDTKVFIEGYSFNAEVGYLVDLVTFSTLLRKKVYDNITKDINILSPATLKLESCKLTYPPIIKEIGGKKPRVEYIWKNTIGMPGGKFTKHDMFMAIVDNAEFNDRYSMLCKLIKPEIMALTKMPKPFDDVTDCFLMFKVGLNKNRL